MSRNHPERSRNGREWSRRVLEGSGRFHKFSDSTICAPPPLALGGKALQGGWPKFGWWGRHMWKESSLDSDSPVGRTPFESRSPKGTPTPLIAPKGPPGHLYKEGKGWGAQHNSTLAPCATLPSLNPVSPLLDPG